MYFFFPPLIPSPATAVVTINLVCRLMLEEGESVIGLPRLPAVGTPCVSAGQIGLVLLDFAATADHAAGGVVGALSSVSGVTALH